MIFIQDNIKQYYEIKDVYDTKFKNKKVKVKDKIFFDNKDYKYHFLGNFDSNKKNFTWAWKLKFNMNKNNYLMDKNNIIKAQNIQKYSNNLLAFGFSNEYSNEPEKLEKFSIYFFDIFTSPIVNFKNEFEYTNFLITLFFITKGYINQYYLYEYKEKNIINILLVEINNINI
jgi:hypothetical protein